MNASRQSPPRSSGTDLELSRVIVVHVALRPNEFRPARGFVHLEDHLFSVLHVEQEMVVRVIDPGDLV